MKLSGKEYEDHLQTSIVLQAVQETLQQESGNLSTLVDIATLVQSTVAILLVASFANATDKQIVEAIAQQAGIVLQNILLQKSVARNTKTVDTSFSVTTGANNIVPLVLVIRIKDTTVQLIYDHLAFKLIDIAKQKSVAVLVIYQTSVLFLSLSTDTIVQSPLQIVKYTTIKTVVKTAGKEEDSVAKIGASSESKSNRNRIEIQNQNQFLFNPFQKRFSHFSIILPFNRDQIEYTTIVKLSIFPLGSIPIEFWICFVAAGTGEKMPHSPKYITTPSLEPMTTDQYDIFQGV
jgi:hypothetical protein